jgi:hypothetical protein
MKKLAILPILYFVLQTAFANIYVPPGAAISELYCDANGDWQLEISYFTGNDEYFNYDSIVISTAKFSYKLHLPVINEQEIAYLILNKSKIGDSLDIIGVGDSIYIKTYIEEGYVTYDENSLIFGNYKNSMISKPEEGKSIALFEGLNRFYALSNLPTLGAANNPIGALGRIQGKIIVSEEEIPYGGSFAITFEFRQELNGDYFTYLLPGEHKISQIYFDYYEVITQWIDIQPLEFTIKIGDTLNRDIQVTDKLFLNVNENKVYRDFEVYPNPASDRIFIDPKDYQKYKTVTIQLLDINGRAVVNLTKSADESIKINLQNNIKAGIYILNIQNQDRVVYSEKIIVNPF